MSAKVKKARKQWFVLQIRIHTQNSTQQMAAFLSNQFLLSFCPCSSSFPFQTPPQPKIARFPSRPFFAPILGFPTPSSSANRWTLFKSMTNDETAKTQNATSVKNNDGDKKPLPNLMVLIEAYKEAFLNGDEKIASQIEERIHSIANENSKLIRKVSTLSAEKIASKEKCIRLQADFDNFRKRCDKERLNTQFNAQQEVIKKLLLLVDNFERVKQQTEAATEKEKKIDASYQGIYKQFVETMRSHHVSVVATVGKPFNPMLHEAVGREKSEVFKEGIIIKESRRGFLLKDKVLRPALVKVSIGPGNKKSPTAAATSTDQPSTTARIDER